MRKRYIKLYEEFRLTSPTEYEATTIEPTDVELSDKTVDDVLSDTFFNEEEEEKVDDNGVITIAGWNIY